MPEKFESQDYRDELAREVKEAPKDDKQEILGKAKATPEYWQARTEKTRERQHEEEIDDGLGIFIKKKTLYHGSGIAEIKKFDKAEEDTVGSGIYFTSEAKDAIGYARLRAKRERTRRDEQRDENTEPIIYESSVEDIKLCDLRKDENVRAVLDGFKQILKEELKKPDLTWNWRAVLEETVEAINSGKIGAGNLKLIAQRTGHMFSDYVQSLGYEGLTTFEGGEGDNDSHDTYLIFDSDKIKINQEHKII